MIRCSLVIDFLLIKQTEPPVECYLHQVFSFPYIIIRDSNSKHSFQKYIRIDLELPSKSNPTLDLHRSKYRMFVSVFSLTKYVDGLHRPRLLRTVLSITSPTLRTHILQNRCTIPLNIFTTRIIKLVFKVQSQIRHPRGT